MTTVLHNSNLTNKRRENEVFIQSAINQFEKKTFMSLLRHGNIKMYQKNPDQTFYQKLTIILINHWFIGLHIGL